MSKNSTRSARSCRSTTVSPAACADADAHWVLVLRPGGTYLSQQVGAGSNRELTEAMMGPQVVNQGRSTHWAAAAARAAGLTVTGLQERALRVEFFDIAAVVYFLRKVLWTVPGFSVERYRPQLAAVHEQIQSGTAFVAHSQRFLIEARR